MSSHHIKANDRKIGREKVARKVRLNEISGMRGGGQEVRLAEVNFIKSAV